GGAPPFGLVIEHAGSGCRDERIDAPCTQLSLRFARDRLIRGQSSGRTPVRVHQSCGDESFEPRRGHEPRGDRELDVRQPIEECEALLVALGEIPGVKLQGDGQTAVRRGVADGGEGVPTPGDRAHRFGDEFAEQRSRAVRAPEDGAADRGIQSRGSRQHREQLLAVGRGEFREVQTLGEPVEPKTQHGLTDTRGIEVDTSSPGAGDEERREQGDTTVRYAAGEESRGVDVESVHIVHEDDDAAVRHTPTSQLDDAWVADGVERAEGH
ncbi:hypothetical protein COLO4_02638, partial [Corchorus olitorius]